MDFSAFNPRKSAERGVKLHLRHPVLNHLLYYGSGADPDDGQWVNRVQSPQPITVTVRGFENRGAQERLHRIRDATTKGPPSPSTLAVVAGEETSLDFVCSVVIGFTGITRNSVPLAATEVNKRMFFEQSENLVEQVIDFVNSRSSNTLKDGS